MSEPDFRSNPSETNEGKGIARRAWDAYAKTVNEKLGPTLHPLIEPAAAPKSWSVIYRTVQSGLGSPGRDRSSRSPAGDARTPSVTLRRGTRHLRRLPIVRARAAA